MFSVIFQVRVVLRKIVVGNLLLCLEILVYLLYFVLFSENVPSILIKDFI